MRIPRSHMKLERVAEKFKKNSRICEFMALVLKRYNKSVIIINKSF